MPEARLEEPSLGTLLLDEDNGFIVQAVERTTPEPRQSSTPRVDADGEDDQTSRFGAAAVTVDLHVCAGPTGTVQQLTDRLRAYCAPARRPYLIYRPTDDDDERRILLSSGQAPTVLRYRTHMQARATWRAPDGVAEAAEAAEVSLNATATVELGVSFPLTFDVGFPGTPTIGASTLTNNGTVAVAPTIRIYGPCTDPRIANETVGRALIFDGLDIAAGDYVDIDVKARTVRLNSEPAQSHYNQLDFAQSRWWALEPGTNEVRFYPVTAGDACVAEIRWRDAWL